MVRERGKLGSSSSSAATQHKNDDHGSKSTRSSSIASSKLKAMFAKRSMGLKKKIFELATLCDLDACLIIKGPNGELETWPENRIQLEGTVQRYKNLNQEQRQKHITDLSSFIKDKKNKLETVIDKIQNENYSRSKSLYPTWNHKLDELSEDSLREMRCSLESKLEKVKSRVEMNKKQAMMMNRGDAVVDDQKEDFSAMGTDDYDSPLLPLLMIQPQPSLVPQTLEFVHFNSSHHHHYHQQQQNHNFFPIGGSMASMSNPGGFGMMENHHHLHQYSLMGDHHDGNYYSTNNFVSLPPCPPTTNFSHDLLQPQPLQTCVPPSFQFDEQDYFPNNMYSHHQQQQHDFDFMPINGGDRF